MLNSILKWSIAQRWLVVIGAIVITILGSYNLMRMPLDVFPTFALPQSESASQLFIFATGSILKGIANNFLELNNEVEHFRLPNLS